MLESPVRAGAAPMGKHSHILPSSLFLLILKYIILLGCSKVKQVIQFKLSNLPWFTKPQVSVSSANFIYTSYVLFLTYFLPESWLNCKGHTALQNQPTVDSPSYFHTYISTSKVLICGRIHAFTFWLHIVTGSYWKHCATTKSEVTLLMASYAMAMQLLLSVGFFTSSKKENSSICRKIYSHQARMIACSSCSVLWLHVHKVECSTTRIIHLIPGLSDSFLGQCGTRCIALVVTIASGISSDVSPSYHCAPGGHSALFIWKVLVHAVVYSRLAFCIFSVNSLLYLQDKKGGEGEGSKQCETAVWGLWKFVRHCFTFPFCWVPF